MLLDWYMWSISPEGSIIRFSSLALILLERILPKGFNDLGFGFSSTSWHGQGRQVNRKLFDLHCNRDIHVLNFLVSIPT